MSSEKSWLEIIAAVLASSGIVGLIQYWFGGRRKVHSESDKTSAEADAVKLEIKIKKEDYYEKKFNEAMSMIEKLETKNNFLMQQSKLQDDTIQSLKRTITMLKIQLHQQ